MKIDKFLFFKEPGETILDRTYYRTQFISGEHFILISEVVGESFRTAQLFKCNSMSYTDASLIVTCRDTDTCISEFLKWSDFIS